MAVSHPEQRQPGDQAYPVERTVHLPPETPEGPPEEVPEETAAEITQELPAVPPQHQPEHLKVGGPLLDLLAPQQGEHPHTVPSPQPPLHQAVRRWPSRRGVLLVGSIGTVILAAVIGAWVLNSSLASPASPAPSVPSQDRPSRTAVPTISADRVVDGYRFSQHAARSDIGCAANAYGKAAEFFQDTPCTRLDRALYGTTVEGRLIVVSVSVVHMPDEPSAEELQRLVDTSGTGNVDDLLRAGVRVPGGPDSLTDAGYASTMDGSTVIIAESDFAEQAMQDEDLLDRISAAALQLRT
jgi:hypothetical protein